MLIQKQTKSKSRTPLLIVLGLVFVVTIVVAFRTYFSEPDLGPAGEVQAPSSTISTQFDTSILQDSRLRSLRTFGAADVQVVERGRKANPFQAF